MIHFDSDYYRQWHSANWHYSLYISLFYLISLFSGKKWMSKRKACKLDTPLFIWNLCLSLFSVAGFLNLFSAIYLSFTKKGLYGSLCDFSFDLNTQRWLWLFTWSKVVELGDTFFIVIRKRKLIILHWVHHTLALCFCFYFYSQMASTSVFVAFLNMFAHSFMYAYYALKTLGVRISKSIAMAITTSQIVQMIFGIGIHMLVLCYKLSALPCKPDYNIIKGSFMFYTTFLLFFANYFTKTYLLSNPRPEKLTD